MSKILNILELIINSLHFYLKNDSFYILIMSNNQKEDIGYIKRDICFTNNLNIIKLLIK